MALSFDSDFLKKLEYLHILSKRVFAGQFRAERISKKRGSRPSTRRTSIASACSAVENARRRNTISTPPIVKP